MTETDPGAARPNAGTVGVHRQDVSEPVTEPESLNAVRQARPGPEPVETARDTAGHTETRRTGEHEKGHDEISEVRRDIERTRDDLGDTIEALAAKADIKGRAQERVHATMTAARARATGVAGRVREAAPPHMREAAGRAGEQVRTSPGLVAAAGAVVAAGGAVLLLRRMTGGRGRPAKTTGLSMPLFLSGTGLGKRGGMVRRSLSEKAGLPARIRLYGKKTRMRGRPAMFRTTPGRGVFGKSMLGGKGMFGRGGVFGGKAMFGKGTSGKGTSGKGTSGKSMFGKGMLGGKGMFGKSASGKGVFGGSRTTRGARMFPTAKHNSTFTRRFAHR
ncbi:DUF3618 domain-containing protein [Microbispora cellulosiformans]|uniref:DUF3618 domain-containing protein n=1 Tax=Microbispora cellulosiformans TaxID=2614688 RepID=A0A5J5KA90_9ACTN|nr:DUF3618 domain-containing protein [Microbispora cellulosiformans]KAA9380472.1 DUF3618 domain-containing protein [Microbispora cellulosiformans]